MLENVNLDFGKDSIIIRKFLSGLDGGRSIDMTGFEKVEAGHVIIYDTVNEVYKPMPITSGEYDELPDGCEYVGILVSTILTSMPFGSIMNAGSVCEPALPYAIDSIKSAFSAVLPTIVFVHD